VAPAAAAGPLDSVWTVTHTGETLSTVSVVVIVQDGDRDDDPAAIAILFGDGGWVYGWFGPQLLSQPSPLVSPTGGLVRFIGPVYTPQGDPFGTVLIELVPGEPHEPQTLTGVFLEGELRFELAGRRLF